MHERDAQTDIQTDRQRQGSPCEQFHLT